MSFDASTSRSERRCNPRGAVLVGALLAWCVFAAVPASGHHSFVGFYDQNRIVEIEGVVRSVSWHNPHGSITLDVTDGEGRVSPWQIETGSISVLRVRGFDREFVQVGDHVRIAGEAALRRDKGLYARNMLLPSGDEVLLSIGISPRWTDPDTGALLEARFDDAVAAAARREADGIFRVWATVLDDPRSFPLFKGGYPLTEAAARRKAAWDASDVEQLGCAPKGMPAIMITPFPVEFVASGEDIVLRFEEDDADRLIVMGPTAPDLAPALLGRSRGRWEGTTLVVETDRVSAEHLDGEGTPLGAQARFVERFAPSEDGTRLDYTIEIVDPETFTERFELERYFVWRPELEVKSYDCSVSTPRG
jgi:hypothetical protein